MKTVRVGYSRLYNAAGCSVLGKKEVQVRFTVDGIDVSATIGPGFKHIMLESTFGPPKPKDGGSQEPPTRRRGYKVPSPELFPADLYVEVIASKEIELDDDLAAAFYGKESDAQNEVIRRATLQEKAFTKALDLAAGSLGLRLHHTLVAMPIHDQCFAYRRNGDPYVLSVTINIITTASFKLKVVNGRGNSAQKILPPLQSTRDWKRAADTLAWLLRAWASKDPVLQFVSLFTALECVIPAVADVQPTDWEENRDTILDLINKHASTKERKRLVNYLKRLRIPSASLAERFEYWASKEALTGWKKDIVAFKKFSRMRNLMYHAGDPEVEFRISIDDDDVRSLADIVERYVSLALFGDANVYQSSSRPLQWNPESVIRITMSVYQDA